MKKRQRRLSHKQERQRLRRESFLERLWKVLNRSEKRYSPKEFEMFREQVEVAEQLPRTREPRTLGTILPFRTWRILVFAFVISVANWVLWGVLDDLKASIGGVSGALAFLDASLQEVASQIWGWTCVFPTPSEGPEACLYMPNLLILFILAVMFIAVLAFGVDGLVHALREDDDRKRKEDRDTTIAAVLVAIRYMEDYREAMKHNAEFKREDQERRVKSG